MMPEGHDENNSKLPNNRMNQPISSRMNAQKLCSNPPPKATSRSSETPLEPISTQQIKREKSLHVVRIQNNGDQNLQKQKVDAHLQLCTEYNPGTYSPAIDVHAKLKTASIGDGTAQQRKSSSVKHTSEPARSFAQMPPRPTNGTRQSDTNADNLSNTPRSRETSSPKSRPMVKSLSRRSTSPNKIPRIPKETSSQSSSHQLRNSPRKPLHQEKDSVNSLSHASSVAQCTASSSQQTPTKAYDEHEQILFEQRLCEGLYGVAIRKINQYGKSNLRYVKCVYLDASEADDVVGSSAKSRSSAISSVSSLARTLSKIKQTADRSANSINSRQDQFQRNNTIAADGRRRVLTWGKKKIVRIPLNRFMSVRKGKKTEKARRNPVPASRILSLITDVPNHPSLDIEAPTQLDRDKFARAFSKFLQVPIEGDLIGKRLVEATTISKLSHGNEQGRQLSSCNSSQNVDYQGFQQNQSKENISAPLPVVLASGNSNINKPIEVKNVYNSGDNAQKSKSGLEAAIVIETQEKLAEQSHSSAVESDDMTHVSSLTEAAFDQEIVEELHHALNDMRAELEESRAEAARAVKVAEQAIQSAENSDSRDWHSTVTHKAAEAAAMAQKKSAEAMAKQRLAEDSLDAERRNATFWRRQAEVSEEEAGSLQTRAAAAEVQRELMAEELESERRKAAALVDCIKKRFSSSEIHQKEALDSAMERNRALELELDGTRRDLRLKSDEAKTVQESLYELRSDTNESYKNSTRKKIFLLGRKKKNNDHKNSTASQLLLNGVNASSSNCVEIQESSSSGIEDVSANAERVLKLHAEAIVVRKQFELLKKATIHEFRSLPGQAKSWVSQASHAIGAAQTEMQLLREKLAQESATRRKLLHQVQDLRGSVRVYCRPRPCMQPSELYNSVISVPSHEAVLVHGERTNPTHASSTAFPLSFQFDRVFQSNIQQREVYNEIEEVCLGVLDGYNICVMAYGQTGTGKTYALLGDVEYSAKESIKDIRVQIKDYGIHFETMRQLFSIAEHRSDRYEDTFNLTIVEVYKERLCDLLTGTDKAEEKGRVSVEETTSVRRKKRNKGRIISGECSPSRNSGSKQGNTKLEIRTNHNGDTVVQGLVSIKLESFDDVRTIWEQCLLQRARRLAEQGIDLNEYEAASHVIATLNVSSMNVATGMGSEGRIVFADIAGSDLIPRRIPGNSKKISAGNDILASAGSQSELKFSNKSLSTLSDVVSRRSRFIHDIPYRNSTLTHLLRDNLEADAKVLCLVCVSSDAKDLQETISSLRFAAKIRRVNIGKATKHTFSRS